MRHADLVGLLFRVLPFDAWKDALLRGHIENCPACRRRLASREEARRILVRSEDAGIPGGFWPAIADRIGGCEIAATAPLAGIARPAEPVPAPKRWAWRWAAAVFGTALAVVLTIALVRFLQTPAPAPYAAGAVGAAESEPDQVRIHYVRIDNEPAHTFIFKPHDSDVVIVWAGKNI
jgi:hypothetical protein